MSASSADACSGARTPEPASPPPDLEPAQAFAQSRLLAGDRFTYALEEAQEWFEPLRPEDFKGRCVLELGCGNASLLIHCAGFAPAELAGVELGDSIDAARSNLDLASHPQVALHRGDLVTSRGETQDTCYCIGVLHHLKRQQHSFESLLVILTIAARLVAGAPRSSNSSSPGSEIRASWDNVLMAILTLPINYVGSRWLMTRFSVEHQSR